VTNEVADVLERAADLIETVGHCKRRHWEFISPNYGTRTAYCAIGAITAVSSGRPYMHALWALRTEIYGPPEGWAPYQTIPAWNDAPERTAAEVIDMLRQAAKTVRNEHVGPQ
jgi:hypothetical protein